MDFTYYYQVYRLWIEENYYAFQMADAILFFLFSITVVYLFVFVVASKIKKDNKYSPAGIYNRILTIVTVSDDNESIFESLQSISSQNYPLDLVSICVVANRCSSDFVLKMEAQGATVIETFTGVNNYSSDYSCAIEYYDSKNVTFDILFMLHSGNLIEPDMLDKINNAYYAGCDAVQTHRIAKEHKTTTSILEAVGEEINSSIFRKGHTAMGLSSGFMGSGMTFDYELFRSIQNEVRDPLPEKQIEIALLKKNIYIEYLESAYTYDDKTSNRKSYIKKKRRWSATQRVNLSRSILSLPKYFLKGQLDYCNKVFQWMLPSRIVFSVLVVLIMFLVFLINWTLSIKW